MAPHAADFQPQTSAGPQLLTGEPKLPDSSVFHCECLQHSVLLP